jgi:sugar phosphate isomerase/epimerase
LDTVLSTHLFVNNRLTTVWLDRIWQAGIPHVEIFCARQHLDYRDASQIRELGHWFRDAQLRVHALHSPMYNDDCWGRTGPDSVITITEPVKRRRIEMVDEIKRVLEIAETVPYRFLIQHLGVNGEDYDERKIESAFTALEELTIFARQRGVEILIENIPNALSSGERLLLFNEITHLDLHFCFDTGHANMMSSVESEFALMKDRIRSTHIHDNDGVADTHRIPLLHPGTIDWRRTIELLNTRAAQYPLVLEIRDDGDLAQPIDTARETFARLQELL